MLFLRNLSGYSGKLAIFILIFLILAIGTVVLKDYLFFDKLYVFRDIGGDAYNQQLPGYVHIARYLRTEGIPKWSFFQGMGQNIFPGYVNNPFHLMLYALGKGRLIYGIAYVEFLKILLGGIFFFLYARLLSLTQFASIAAGLLFAFSGYMILGSGWYVHSTFVVFGAFLLFSFEKLFKHNSWGYFPVAVFLIGSQSAFYLYTLGLFLLFYAGFRFFDERGGDVKGFCALFFKMLGLALLGMAINSFFLIGDILRMIQSPRVGGEAGLYARLMSTPVFSFSNGFHYITALFRLFSNDLQGTGSSFKGWNNYLEAPSFYCGLISILLVPQLFIFLNRKQKKLYASYLLLWLSFVIFPFFRFAFYAFTGNYYKGGLSLFISVTILFFSIHALSEIDRLKKVNIPLLLSALGLCLVVLFFPFYPERVYIDTDLRNISATLLIFYAILIFVLKFEKRKIFTQTLLILALCIELGYFSSITMNKRLTITADEWEQKKGYNDYTKEAVAYINALDKSLFRINKDYSSGTAVHSSINDAQIQNFYGTMSYHSFNQFYYIKFLSEMNIIQGNAEHQTRWAMGLIAKPLLQTFASIKYNLSKRANPVLLRPGSGYDVLTQFGDVKVLINRYYLPFGYTYDHFMRLEDFQNLSPDHKQQLLLKAFVIDHEQIPKVQGLNMYSPLDISDKYSFSQYGKDIDRLRKNSLAISEHSQNVIKGTITLDNKKLLFFTIPYDRGWTAIIDGQEQKIDLVNIGFMGLLLDKGDHDVVLRYHVPYYTPGLLVSIFSFLLYIGLLGWKHLCNKDRIFINEKYLK